MSGRYYNTTFRLPENPTAVCVPCYWKRTFGHPRYAETADLPQPCAFCGERVASFIWVDAKWAAMQRKK